MSNAIERYECGRCGEVHDEEDWAIECCAPTVKVVYECRECGECYDDEDEANDCCLGEGGEKPEPTATLFPDPAYAFSTEAYIKEFGRLNHFVGYTDEPTPKESA